jgi:hypothetical protein
LRYIIKYHIEFPLWGKRVSTQRGAAKDTGNGIFDRPFCFLEQEGMEAAFGQDRVDEIFLNLTIRKSNMEEIDENGNFIFEVEASNENLDIQKQIVLQRALLESKDHFLSNGVVSYDHLHKRRGQDGQIISDPAMIIGEPVEVRTEGTRTIVRGILYKSNEIAQDIWKKLKDKSSRVKASIGGIFPKVVKDAASGKEKIVSVLWNDLALTFSPINSTVAPAFAKSYLEPFELAKALMAGAGMDHKTFTNGRAIIPEDVESHTITVTETGSNAELEDKIRGLMAALNTGEVKGYKQAIKYLKNQGLDMEQARTAVHAMKFFAEGRS